MKVTLRDRARYWLDRLRERLWVRPLFTCVLSVAAAFLAKMADGTGLDDVVADISRESVEALLRIMAASMLVIATFAVASMVGAYSAAGNSATPRSFRLVVADDVSQNALSTFIGAFIYSIVALMAVMNGYFEKAARFALFAFTLFVFAAVVLMFVRWVDQIARLGRLGSTIRKVEDAATAALRRRQRQPNLGGLPVEGPPGGSPVFADRVGYLQRVHMEALDGWAEKAGARVTLVSLPGAFVSPGRALAHVTLDSRPASPDELAEARSAFVVGDERTYEDDPRFGIVVLAEIAGRALSPAVNDPGTAIAVVGTLVRLFTLWVTPGPGCEPEPPKFHCVHVPALRLADLFDDAFTAIARDGAGSVEVQVRLQKALASLAATGDKGMQEQALRHARLALERAERALVLPHDLEQVRDAAYRGDARP